MDVSTFELLFKPLTPSGGDPTLQAVGRRVFTGTFLTVANREDVDLRYRIEFDVSLPDPDQAARRLEGALFIVDAGAGTGGAPALGSDNRFEPFTASDRVGSTSIYRKTFTVRARRTALVAAIPNLTSPGFFGSTTPTVEIRGVVALFLPGNRLRIVRENGQFVIIPGGPQLDRNARVLVQAELRSTYLPNNFLPTTPNLTALDLDQTTTALELANGRSLQELVPEPGLPFLLFDRIEGLAERLGTIQRQRALMPLGDEERALEVVESLADIGRDDDTLAEVNRLLDALDAPVTLARRHGASLPPEHAFGGRVRATLGSKK